MKLVRCINNKTGYVNKPPILLSLDIGRIYGVEWTLHDIYSIIKNNNMTTRFYSKYFEDYNKLRAPSVMAHIKQCSAD